jgi:RND superfamily putative drug exporter
VLVPALMIIIGEANWRIPAWLDRLLPRLNVEGRAAREPHRIDTPVPEPAAG